MDVEDSLKGGMRELSGVKKVFVVLIGVVISCVYTFLEIYQNVCFGFLNCILRKSCFKNETNINLVR